MDGGPGTDRPTHLETIRVAVDQRQDWNLERLLDFLQKKARRHVGLPLARDDDARVLTTGWGEG